MRIQRVLSALLSAALAAGLVLPAGAAGLSSFPDVSDPAAAVNADILRLMGVVSGAGDGKFNPDAALTRAEFCTMTVKFMQKGDEVGLHAARTIFSDVTARHWALGYVNLAASLTVKDGERETALISGTGDGRFEPESSITLAQACTILLRVLGYTSRQAGTVWPQSYMALAASVGLTDGVPAGTNDAITRSQAARLFVNALRCKTGSGEVYYKSLGTDTDGVIVLAVGVETDDGSSRGAIRTSANKEAESYLAAAGEVKPAALVGKRGALVLNKRGEIVTFVPDDSNAVTVTLAGDAQPGYLKGSDGRQYIMSRSTLVYTAGSREGAAYSDQYASLYSGSQVTLYSQGGKIVAVYAQGGVSSGGGGAVVVSGKMSAASFSGITGGVSTFSIQKNRQPISVSSLRENDVVTYDSLTNTLVASDLRLTCIYEDASPNAKAPTEIKVLGHTFPVLESAWDTAPGAKLGSQVTLLLTADGQVAGFARPEDGVRSTAIGIAGAGSVQVLLPGGGSFDLSGTLSSEKLEGQLVQVSSNKRGQISLSRMPSRETNGILSIQDMKLGSMTVTAGVRIYEQAGEGAVTQVSLGNLGMEDIPGSRVSAYHLNSSGMVDYIVLKDYTGDAYLYGMLKATTITTPAVYDEDGVTVLTPAESSITWELIRGSGSIKFSQHTGYTGSSGSFAGVSIGENSAGEKILRSVQTLTAVKGVKPSDFFELEGVQYVRAGGRTYQVSENVECCQNTTLSRYGIENWFQQETGAARLAACRAVSDDLTICIDPVGSKVRILIAN